MHHYLWPLLEPASIAFVGASERAGSLGAVVFDHLIDGGYGGAIYPVNPRHRAVRGRECWPDVQAIGKPIELAIVATPPHAVAEVLGAASRARVRTVVVMTMPPPGDARAEQRWVREVAAAARRGGVRMVGPGAIGIVRPAIGLNATFCAPDAKPGRLALVVQSGAVATAMLDFAEPLGIGFSSVISLGLGGDVGFGDLLDCLLQDPGTDGIVLYVERLDEARTFLSALRAAARTKPVVVLKAGRSLEAPGAVTPDAVFSAAMTRSGTVRVTTYTQLFAAVRVLALGRIPQGDRVAIVANGRGPALLAADRAYDCGVLVPAFAAATSERLRRALADAAAGNNPVDVRGDATPAALADATRIALEDPGIDAVVALHVPRPSSLAVDAARALASVAQAQRKPVLAAWLGALDRDDVHAALGAGGVPNFFTPENAVEALSWLIAYRRNQAWLLEVPPPQPEPEAPDLAALEALRAALVRDARSALTQGEALVVLAAFGIGAPVARAASFEEAEAAARTMRFPLTLAADVAGRAHARVARGPRSLARAWHALLGDVRGAGDARAGGDAWDGRVTLRETPRGKDPAAVSVGVVPDATFGPVITLSRERGKERSPGQPPAMMLPPLNARLARDLVAEAGGRFASVRDGPEPVAAGGAGAAWLDAAEREALTALLIRISALVCALPWVETLVLDPVLLDRGRAFVAGIKVRVDPRHRLQRGYPHMAIHPYPVELISELSLRDGTRLMLRPIRPEDAELEKDFVAGLSEQARYFRFFYRMGELAPAMLARFTQVDYDRELALVAITGAEEGGKPAFVAVARYLANPDLSNAEFAIVVGDAWQRRGIATLLMRKLVECAKRRGFARMSGVILRENDSMLALMRALGFAIEDDPEDPSQVVAAIGLA
jgi:acetyltransferase